MFRYLVPTILTGAAIAGFFVFAKPIMGEISDVKQEIASYNEALDNANALENERDKLTTKLNSIDPVNLSKLEKLLPDSVDNIRLILEIEKIASPYGMLLKDVTYDSTTNTGNSSKPNTQSGISGDQTQKDTTKGYGEWSLGFSTQGSYTNFLSFVKDLESNLRMVEIQSITFSSGEGVSLGKVQPSDYYKYDFKIKTFWLKN